MSTGAGEAAAPGAQAHRHGTPHPSLVRRPQLIAHRGGAGLYPENTLLAFRRAVEEWAADAIELDVHATADGHCVVIHDPTVERTTDGTGRVAEMTLEALRRLDAGYRFTPDGGRTFPFRGQGLQIPTIEEVLAGLPEVTLIAEVKARAAQAPLFEAVRRAGAEQRVIAAGMRDADRDLFDRYGGPISASVEQLRRFIILHRLRLWRLWRPPVDVVQMPEHWGDRRVLTPGLIGALHAWGLPVQVWTVDDVSDMERLLESGVDGIITDRPDRLAAVLVERAGRPPAPALLQGGGSGTG
ncbi:MAG TPA: glycerophosphodiester phosphodiesterase [Longimicrobiales bacterium]